MKLVRFDAGQGPRLGALLGDRIVDLLAAARARMVGGVSGQDAAFDFWYGPDPNGLIAGGAAALHNARQVLARTEEALAKGGTADGVLPRERVKLLAPLAAPSKILCVGQNYLDHIREQKTEVPKTPIIFSKAPTCLLDPGAPVTWPAGVTSQVDLEVELGVVIGKRAKGLTEANALEAVFGYAVLNDVSARDAQFSDKQWVRGKSLDGFCPLGPWLVTKDEIRDPQALRLTSSVNGRTWQDSNTKEMIFPVATLLAFITQGITLLPGDLVATGTPHGVGMFQKPPVFLQAGDRMRLEVEGLGVLENPVGGAQ